MRILLPVLTAIVFCAMLCPAESPPFAGKRFPAFPDAEGAGAYAAGGRGGTVFLVTTLEDYHP